MPYQSDPRWASWSFSERMGEMGDAVSRDCHNLMVVGYDGSSASRNALAYAFGLARREGSEVVVAEVNPVYSHISPLGISAPTPWSAGKKGACVPGDITPLGDITSALEEWLPGRWWVESCQGDPASELERLGEELRSDAIVIGRSRRSGRLPFGSVTKRLIRKARRPVIVVP